MGKPIERALRILVVDDDPFLGSPLCRCFAHAGHEARHARTASEAARMLDEAPIDVGVFDIDLGDACGLTLARDCLDSGRIPAVVFFSAVVDRKREGRAAALGTLVPKGVSFEILLGAVLTAAAGSRSIRG